MSHPKSRVIHASGASKRSGHGKKPEQAANVATILPTVASRPCYHRRMDSLTIFGLFAVTAMLVFYALEDRSHWYILAFAGACALGSAYGFLQGAWPFGVIEAIWAAVALYRWRSRMMMTGRAR
jgi:hypothetical protein